MAIPAESSVEQMVDWSVVSSEVMKVVSLVVMMVWRKVVL